HPSRTLSPHPPLRCGSLDAVLRAQHWSRLWHTRRPSPVSPYRREVEMRSQARVVIVGGGIAGCSVAFHLAEKGWTDVVLVDKGELTSGTTWHAAGMVTHFHTSPTLMRMRQYSIALYRRLQAEPGSVEHWHEVGSLRVASSRDQLRFLERQVGMAKAIGLDVDTISPAESLRIFPLMSGEHLHGAMYLPGDGWLDPSGATMELAAHARRLGVEIHGRARHRDRADGAGRGRG